MWISNSEQLFTYIIYNTVPIILLKSSLSLSDQPWDFGFSGTAWLRLKQACLEIPPVVAVAVQKSLYTISYGEHSSEEAGSWGDTDYMTRSTEPARFSYPFGWGSSTRVSEIDTRQRSPAVWRGRGQEVPSFSCCNSRSVSEWLLPATRPSLYIPSIRIIRSPPYNLLIHTLVQSRDIFVCLCICLVYVRILK